MSLLNLHFLDDDLRIDERKEMDKVQSDYVVPEESKHSPSSKKVKFPQIQRKNPNFKPENLSVNLAGMSNFLGNSQTNRFSFSPSKRRENSETSPILLSPPKIENSPAFYFELPSPAPILSKSKKVQDGPEIL